MDKQQALNEAGIGKALRRLGAPPGLGKVVEGTTKSLMDKLGLTDEEIYAITSIHPRFVKKWPGAKALADAATRKMAWASIRKLEQVYGENNASARLLKEWAETLGIQPWEQS